MLIGVTDFAHVKLLLFQTALDNGSERTASARLRAGSALPRTIRSTSVPSAANALST